MDTSSLDCPDGCGLTMKDMDQDLIEKVAAIHEIVPVQCTSGIRCKKHNDQVGGATNSYHLSGKAIDFVPFQGLKKCFQIVIDTCKNLGIIGIRIYPVHVHVDSRAKPHFWLDPIWRKDEQRGNEG